MKKIANKKLGLHSETVRVLSGEQLDAAQGGTIAAPTTTVATRSESIGTAPCHRHSLAATPVPCRSLGVVTAMCVRPPVAG